MWPKLEHRVGADAIDRPLRILHVVLEVSETEFPCNELCAASYLGQEVSVCCFFQPTTSMSPDVALYAGDGSFRAFFRALRQAFDARAYDVVHAHTPHVAFLLLPIRLLMRGCSMRWVYTAHFSYTNPNVTLKHRLAAFLVFATFSRVVCVSNASRDSFPRLYHWLAGDRLTVVTNGVHLARVDRSIGHLRENPKTEFKVVSVGRLVEVKNPFSVFEAFKRAGETPARLVFVGEGKLQGRLRLLAKGAQRGQTVELVGLLPRDCVYRELATADLFVSASRGEGMPLAVLEAMACRCPVVLSDIPAHREIAQGADFIPLVAPDDVVALAREISKYWRMSLSARRNLGVRCRELVESRFDLLETHREYRKLYLGC